MDQPTGNQGRAALSDYLAAERTLLAWVKTGLALMGFGFDGGALRAFFCSNWSSCRRPETRSRTDCRFGLAPP